jgi:hypothetical protein
MISRVIFHLTMMFMKYVFYLITPKLYCIARTVHVHNKTNMEEKAIF